MGTVTLPQDKYDDMVKRLKATPKVTVKQMDVCIDTTMTAGEANVTVEMHLDVKGVSSTSFARVLVLGNNVTLTGTSIQKNGKADNRHSVAVDGSKEIVVYFEEDASYTVNLSGSVKIFASPYTYASGLYKGHKQEAYTLVINDLPPAAVTSVHLKVPPAQDDWTAIACQPGKTGQNESRSTTFCDVQGEYPLSAQMAPIDSLKVRIKEPLPDPSHFAQKCMIL